MISQDDIEAMKPDTVGAHEALVEFIVAFKGSLDPRLWIKLIEEELEELYKETPGTADHLKELSDLAYVYTGLDLLTQPVLGALMSSDEITTVSKVLHRTERAMREYLEYYGAETIDEAFNRVHKSNMSKLGEDGKPILREDGKVLKGPSYKAPDLSDLVKSKGANKK